MARNGSRSLIWLRRIGVAVLVAAALMALGRLGGHYVQDFVEWVQGAGAAAPILFAAGYAVATVAFVPGSILSLAAGAIFGVGWGLLYVMLGATVGSTVAFLVGRYLARDWARRRIEGDPRFAALDRNIGRQGLKLVFLVRLTPILPYNLLNYALGLTRVRLVHYVVASLGMLPGALLYVYSGWVAGGLTAAVGDDAVGRGPGYYAVMILGLLATAALVVVVTRTARNALQEEVGEEAVEGGDSQASPVVTDDASTSVPGRGTA